ncbi:MAG: polysaccharide biosynthesis protein, partial [Kiloniellales bacterium]
YNLYAIDLEVGESWPKLPRHAQLLDVRDAAAIERALRATRPERLFHAAALKHVPLVEANPLEGIATNVLGTRNVAEACRAAGVAAMVQISTDKAINPTSVMGASKRLAESYCQALDIAGRREGPAGTRFVTVRFGNVLGSTGSVVPLFQRQIARGGPVTITDPQMTRYFMTTKEAVELMLEASALGLESPSQDAGRIYVLDMGAPVKIVDLARQMIRLSGKRPGQDIAIVFTGLRPGEKLFEELFHDQEDQAVAGHPGLRLAAVRTVNLELLARRLDELAGLVASGEREASLALLQRLVPEYSSAARPGGAVASAAS